MGISFSEHQKECISKVIKNKKVLIVSGYAGTGKTKIITSVANEMGIAGLRVLVTCFTGKAAQRLRESFDYVHGNVKVVNFHQVIYKIVDNGDGILRFSKRPDWFLDYDVVLVDESSMIDDQTTNDIVDGNLPTSFFGDPFQLPPVTKKTTMFDEPDILLTEVFRQRGESYILDIATDLRNGTDRIGELPNIHPTEIFDKVDMLKEECPVLFLSNKDRIHFNTSYRRYIHEVEDPQRSDRMVCLKNNHSLSIYNGQILTILRMIESVEINGTTFFRALVKSGDEKCNIFFPKDQIDSTEMFVLQEEDKQEIGSNVLLLDYAYALTAHKAQGSQFEQVVIKIPSWIRRKDSVYFYRWMYTAITRAKEECYIF